MNKDYKRLTKRNYFEGDYSVVPEELSKEITKWKEQHATEITAPPVWYHLGERLCQLEDKIENGTLVEFPITDKDILEDYAHKIFDSWNDITGAVNKNCSWYYEALWVIDDIVGMVWGITSRQYEAKLRELKGE